MNIGYFIIYIIIYIGGVKVRITKNCVNERAKRDRQIANKTQYINSICEVGNVEGFIILYYKGEQIEFKTKEVRRYLQQIIGDLLRGKSNIKKIDKISKEKKWTVEQIQKEFVVEIKPGFE